MEALSRQVVTLLELRKRSMRLLDALTHMHNMEGILTTCSYCKKEVRDSDGEWQHLENTFQKFQIFVLVMVFAIYAWRSTSLMY